MATWAADLEAATHRDPATLDQRLRYLTIITDRFSLEQIHAKLRGLAGTLRKLLVQRCGPLTPAQGARLAAASPAQLDRALERILLAPSAEAVFED